MVITSAINIDMQYKYVNTYVDAVQYDVNSRNVEITLLKAGSRADIPTGSTFEVKFKRPDGSSGSYSELSNGQAAVTKKETNVIVVWLSEFILSEAGATVVSVCVKDGETEVNTFSFIVNVQESPHIGTGLARMYPNTYDATATPSDIAIGKTAYVNGEKILGTSVQAGDGNVDLTGYATEEWVQDSFQPKGNYALKSEIPSVPVQSVNGKTGDVNLTAADVKARPSTWMPSASDVGALPASTTFPVTSVNDRTGDVKLTAELVGARPYNWLPTAADIGALPASTKIPTKVSELKNDAGYLTEVPEEYAKKEDIPTKPSDIGAVATVNGVAPDDNGNVELASATSWNDLSHRPFGDKYGDTFTWDGNIYGLTGAKFSYDFAGRLYNVTSWDYEGPTVEEFRRATITMVSDTGWEQEYTDFTVLDSNSGVHGIEILTTNSSGTTFPLLVYLPDTISGPTGSYTSGLYLLRTDAGAWVKTITIPGCTKLIKTEHLNAKYLPEVEAIGDVWVKDLKERIGAGAGDGDGAVSTVNGVAPDANGNVEIVTSWYDLEDRPFGETVSDTVTWDGNTEGRSSSKFGYDSYHCTYYKVCDTSLIWEEVEGLRVSCVYVTGSGKEQQASAGIYTNGDLIIGGPSGSKPFFVSSPGEGVFLLRDDAPGGNWVKSITIEGYNGFITGLKKLDEKYLPDSVVKSVNGMTGAVTIDVPTKVSQLTNDSGYLTEHQDISGKLDASELPTAINTALSQAKESGEFDGATPVRGVDYYTEADRAEIAAQVVEMLGGNPIFGVVDSNNHIVLNGVLPDGTYSVKYEMQDGSTVNIGNLVLDTNVYYSVTNNLTKCTSNNSAKQVIAGGSYSATISANSGYEMSSIKVTMGGADISSSAVSGGKITITSVTGNVVITAVATEKVVEIINLAVTNATNKTDWNLWCNDARIGSDGGYRSATGQVVTNWIEVGIGDTLYIKGLAWTADTHNAFVYNSEKTKIHGGTMTYWYNNGYSDFETVNGVTTFRATNVSQNDGMKYVRFGAALTGTLDNVIITKNQPIT